jgi:hypothetical protein
MVPRWSRACSWASWAIERMPNALILEYQKSVVRHTLNRLHTTQPCLQYPRGKNDKPNKKPFDANQTAFLVFFMYAFLHEAKNCKTFIIGAQEGTRTPTMLLAST